MRRLVNIFFEAEIKRVFGERQTIIDFILKHERKDRCIDNICHQVMLSEKSARRHLMELKNFETFVRDIARIFASTCIEHKHEELLSSLARQGKINEINRISELEQKWDSYQQEAVDGALKIYPTITKSVGSK